MGYYPAAWYMDPSWWDKPADECPKSLSRKEAEESGMGHREVPSAERIVPELQDLKVCGHEERSILCRTHR